MNESCHTYECVMSHIWMSHVMHMDEACCTYEGSISHRYMSRVAHMNEACRTWMSHGVHMNESCRTWMSHVAHMNEACRTHEGVMSHMIESCHTYEWVMSHIRMSHVAHMNESCRTYEWVMTRPNPKPTLKKQKQAEVALWVCVNESCHVFEWVMSHDSTLNFNLNPKSKPWKQMQAEVAFVQALQRLEYERSQEAARRYVSVCCNVLQRIAASRIRAFARGCPQVCFSVLQYVAACCSVLQCIAVPRIWAFAGGCPQVCCSVLQRGAACCSVLQCLEYERSREGGCLQVCCRYVAGLLQRDSVPRIWTFAGFCPHEGECVISFTWRSHCANTWMSHVTHVNESRHSYGWVMSHIWMGYVTHNKWVISLIWISHVTHTWTGRDTHINESHIWVWQPARVDQHVCRSTAVAHIHAPYSTLHI